MLTAINRRRAVQSSIRSERLASLRRRTIAISLGMLIFVGCGTSHTPKSANKITSTPVAETLAKLPLEDRQAATAQRLCAVSEEPLGSMGVPIKLTIGGQTVWICCQHCEAEAKAHPQETSERAQRLRGVAGLPTP